MMDLCQEEKGSGVADRGDEEYPEADSDRTKRCEDCRTAKTPLWRAGPSGPKSLCNACGIRYQKRRRKPLGLRPGEVNGGRNRREKGGSAAAAVGVYLNLMGLGSEVLWKQQRRRDVRLKQKQRTLGEEEEAAVLLMALSSGLFSMASSNQS